jgi:integrase
VTLDVGSTKNKQGRVFPFADLPELAELLKTQKADTETLERKAATIIPAVFHRSGKRIAAFNGAWRSACKAAGCPGRIPHDFRRTAVRNLVRAGVPEQMAMRLTGHKTRSVFERYNVTTETDLRAAVRKLAGTKQGQSTASAAS